MFYFFTGGNNANISCGEICKKELVGAVPVEMWCQVQVVAWFQVRMKLVVPLA